MVKVDSFTLTPPPTEEEEVLPLIALLPDMVKVDP
jgi:hypothetical protein